MSGGDAVALSVIAEGRDDSPGFESLRGRVGGLQVLAAPAGASSQPSVLNAIVDEAAAHWVLLVKRGERVPDELAAEIARNAGVESRAWGYRIAVRRIYCGSPLTLGPRDPGEIRLWHRRKARLQPDGRMKVQGTVVRLEASIERVVHESEQSHADALRAAGGRRLGLARRLARWLSAAARNAPGSLARPARRYLWIEAGWESRD